MLSKTEKEGVKYFLGKHYSKKIIEYLSKRKIFNSFGNVYSLASIQRIVNGKQENLIVEKAIFSLILIIKNRKNKDLEFRNKILNNDTTDFFVEKFDTEHELKLRGWVFEDEKIDAHITYKKDLLFRIYYDGNLIDEYGFIDEIAIFTPFGKELYRGYHPKSENELDELINSI